MIPLGVAASARYSPPDQLFAESSTVAGDFAGTKTVLGMVVRANTSGRITAIRYCEVPTAVGTMTAGFFPPGAAAGSTAIATATDTAVSGRSGWRTVPIAPQQVTTGQVFMVGLSTIGATTGRYSATNNAHTSDITSPGGRLTAPSSATATFAGATSNSRYQSGASAFTVPTSTYQASHYGLDCVIGTSFETGQPQPEVSTIEVMAVTASAQNAPGEIASNLADANPDTKWLAFASSGWACYQLASPGKAVKYSLTSANDGPERDPKNFQLEGSADGQTWTTLDTQTGIDFPSRFATKTFTVSSPAAYTYYRLNITAVHSGNIVQLADWDLGS